MWPWGALIAAATIAIAWPAAAAPGEEPICADRPGLATPTCTVPAGKVQLETGLVDWTFDRSAGIRNDELAIGETAVKLGITDRLHVEFDLSPYMRSRVRDNGSTTTTSGFGDLGVAAKYRLTGEEAPVRLAIRPFVKLPTAKKPLGNGTIEGGLIVPVEYSIPGSHLSIGLSPELDFVANETGSGHHLAMGQVIALAFPLSSQVSASAELSGAWDWDRSGTVRKYAISGALACLLSKDLQIDAGMIIGLNRSAPDAELYSGIAFRF